MRRAQRRGAHRARRGVDRDVRANDERAIPGATTATTGAPEPVAADLTADATPGAGAGGGGTRLQRAALLMAVGTTASRLTGLLRIIALAYALGAQHVADAYNLANTTPNMIYDIVLGGILAATFIPIFVDRLATRPEPDAWRAISAVVTVAAVILVSMTVIFWVLAPEVINAYTAFEHATRTSGSLAQEKAVATTLLRWFVPQVALYGFISLMTALLNTRRRFAAPMWVPIANNVVVIAVLLAFHAMVPKFPRAPSLAEVQAHSGDLVLLGLGTTAGVILQAIILIPSLRGVGLSKLRWHWEPRHEAVRTVMRLGGWTFGFVVANQVALYVVLALAVAFGTSRTDTDPVSSYTYAYTFMVMPYSVVAVSIMSAVTPDLAERWATGDSEGFRRRLTGGLRATLAVILPAAVGMLILARPASALLLGHGSTTVQGTDSTGAALAMFSIGLPGFCAYLYIVRVLQAMQRTKVAFFLYLLENGINVVLAVALVGPLGVRGLALSLTVAYTLSAAVGVVVLRRWLGALGGPRAWVPLRRAAGASVVMGAVVLVVSDASGADHGLALFARVAGAVAAGALVYGALALVLGGRSRPLALLTGETDGATSTRKLRVERAGGPGLGAAWGDSRVPVDTGPRIRIVPAPGTTARRAPSPRDPARPLAPPGPQRDGTPPDRTRAAQRARAAAADRVGRARPGAPERVAPDPEPADLADDPGEVRWIGGTSTPLRRGLPR